MKKLVLVCSILFFMTSCSNDDDAVQSTAAISGYKITTNSNYDDVSNTDYKRVITGNLANGKLFSTTTTYFENNIVIGTPETVQRYFYTNNLLTQIHLGGNYYDNYFYDSQNRFVGATRIYDDGSTLYYRFVHQNNNTVYCERINLPYNNPSALASQRMILNFDQNDEVISAGYDNDFDGIVSNLYAYTYSNGNMSTVHKPDGTVINYDYSNVVDSYYVLAEGSYGKKVLRLICSEGFCSGTANDFKYSINVTQQDTQEYIYQTLPNNFYNKKAKVESLTNPTGVYTYETEFFFD
jgi:hypothetical protein